MRKRNSIYLLLIVIVIGIYYYYQGGEEAQPTAVINLATQPIYQSDNMVTYVYDPSGLLTYKIIASQVKHFDESSNTEFESPYMTLYAQDMSVTWLIQAQRATLTKDKLLYLYQDVKLDNVSPDAQIEHIRADNAVVDLTTQIVSSEDPVILQGPGYYSTGIGLLGYLKDKTANILENVKTYYNTQEPN